MERKNVWGLSAGAALIGLGIIFLLGQLFEFSVMRYLWPVLIMAAGALFFIGMVAGGRSLGALAVPGSVIMTIGVILFIQNVFGIWSTWTYAWALIISGAGVGLVIFGYWSQLPDLSRAGRVVIIIGLALFLIFGLFFELGATLLGMDSPGGIVWALVLILVGVYFVVAPALRGRLGEGGPVTRSTVEFNRATPQNAALENRPADVTGGDETAGGGAAAETTALSGIRRVHFRALGDMTILQGPREGLEIEADQAIRERIRATVNGDALEIRYDQNWLDWLQPRFWNVGSPVRFTLYVRELVLLEAGGMGNITVPSLLTPRLEIQQHGAGSLTVHQFEGGELVVHQAGLGNIEVEGRVNHQDMRLTGTGNYNAARLESATASVQLTGLGSARIWARDTLDARVTGAGSIEYYGSPQVREQVSGLGSVRRLGVR